MGSQVLLPTTSAMRPSASTTDADAEHEHDQGQPPRRCRPSSSRPPRRPGRRGRASAPPASAPVDRDRDLGSCVFSPPDPHRPAASPRPQDVLEVAADPARGPAEIGRRRRAGTGKRPAWGVAHEDRKEARGARRRGRRTRTRGERRAPGVRTPRESEPRGLGARGRPGSDAFEGR